MPARTIAPGRGACLSVLAAGLMSSAIAQTLPPIVALACVPVSHMGTVDDPEAHHVLNRLTFGPTSDLLAAVKATNGYTQFLQQQLAPGGITENHQLLSIRAQINLPFTGIPWSTGPLVDLDDIRLARLAHATLSHRQLNEVMTEFWENHFNTDFHQLSLWITQKVTGTPPQYINTYYPGTNTQHVQCWMEWTQNEMFRTHALGNFQTLLRELILSPAMMVYLNTAGNACVTGGAQPNENFARELLELYTMGKYHAVTGLANYDQNDIDKVAEILSGWELAKDLVNGYPLVNPQEIASGHCGGAKTLFGGTVLIAAGTAAQQLDELVADLTAHEPVRDFLCRKLVRQFVADAAAVRGGEDDLVSAMKTTWGTQGNLAEVLCILCSSQPFQAATYRWQRVRSPLERVTWNARIWDSKPTTTNNVVDPISFQQPLEDVADMGQALFAYMTPDGFPLASVERLGSSTTLEGVIAGGDIYRSLAPAIRYGFWPWPFSQTPEFYPYVTSVLTTAADQANPTLVAHTILKRLYATDGTPSVDSAAVATALGNNLQPSDLASYGSDLARGIAIAFSFRNATLK